MAARFFGIAQVGKVWHAAEQQIFLKTFLRLRTGKNLLIKFGKFLERKGVNSKFYITPAKIGGKFAGKQFGIRACNVNITVKFYPERVNAFFPVCNFLYFIKK